MSLQTRKINSLGNVVYETICNLPYTITLEEEQLLNSYPAHTVVPVLQKLVEESPDVAITSRAFDALLKLTKFDRVAYLIDLYDNNPEKWRWIVPERLSEFDEPKAVKKLCVMAMTDSDADARYLAVYSLYLMGKIETVSTLEYISKHDDGEDYEGNKIAEIAQKAIHKIKSIEQSKIEGRDRGLN